MIDLTKFLTSDFIRVCYRDNHDSTQMFTKKNNVYMYKQEELQDMNTPLKKSFGKETGPVYREPLCTRLLYEITLNNGRVYNAMVVKSISANSPYITFTSATDEFQVDIKVTDISKMVSAGILKKRPLVPSELVVNSKHRKDLVCHLVEVDYNISPVVSTTLVFEEDDNGKQLIEIPLEHIRSIEKRRK